MRMLFTSTAGYGSFHPLALARAASHDVAYATAEDRRSTVERLGMAFFAAGADAYRAALAALRDEIAGLPSDEEAVGWIAEVARTRAPLTAH
jgi:hypothetical protein